MNLQKAPLEDLTIYLQNQQIISSGEKVTNIEIPGEGNMNYTIRVITNERSIIVKQANPFVQKYPQIPAPQQRALTEATFYITVQENDIVAGMMPGFIAVDAQNFILVLQDLGVAKDMSSLYQKGEHLTESALAKLCLYLQELHTNFTKKEESELMANRVLRRLNYEHIFAYPLMEENGFNLDDVQPGLQAVAMTYKNDTALKDAALQLGEKYMTDGNTLLHGDFYPGSWLRDADAEIKIIDPEFCYYGSAEFDIAVLTAHLHLAAEAPETIEKINDFYRKPDGFNEALCTAFTGMEIMRRLIGLAQLPLSLTLPQKESLLAAAANMITR